MHVKSGGWMDNRRWMTLLFASTWVFWVPLFDADAETATPSESACIALEAGQVECPTNEERADQLREEEEYRLGCEQVVTRVPEQESEGECCYRSTVYCESSSGCIGQ